MRMCWSAGRYRRLWGTCCLAGDRLLANPISQSERRLLATAPRLPVLIGARLLALRRIDIEDADALAVDLQRVAVDHCGAAGDGFRAGCGGDEDQDKGGDLKQPQAASP